MRTPRVRAVERPRVLELLGRVWTHRITLVVAPAGSGKTTSLAQFASHASDPVAWYRADSADGSIAAFLAHVERALTDTLDGLEGGWHDVHDAVHALERWSGPRAALVIDDLHTVRGSPAEALLERLVDYLPPHITVAAASRTSPAFDLTRLRLTGELLELGSDDLRFRTWETEQLFRELYGTLLPPEDLARLTRRVEGWAAGLQLYHLAARTKPPAEQRRLIDVVSSRSRLAREYLTRNVLDTLPDELRTFLIDTCVLGVVTPQLADRLLDRTDSARLLSELEALQLFTIPLDDAGTYRYHEVLRSHLEVLLAERDGEEAVLQHHCRAGELLDEAGFVAEALNCYARCGRWDAVRRLMGDGPDLTGPQRWLDTLPPSIVEHDPWLQLARARAATSDGRFNDALAAYHAAERLFGDAGPAERCRAERLDLQMWLDPLAAPGPGWMGELCAGLRRDPLLAADRLAAQRDPAAVVAAGLLAVAANRFDFAVELLERAIVDPLAGTRTVVTARLALAVIDRLGPEPGPADVIDEVETAAERLGYGLLARQARACLALTDRPEMIAEAGRVVARCDADGDPWGAALARLVQGIGGLGAGNTPLGVLEDAAERFRSLDAPVLENLALAWHDDATFRAGRAADAPAPATDDLARAVGSIPSMPDAPRPVTSVRATVSIGGAAPNGNGADAVLDVRCFGAFSVRTRGAEVDLSVLRPRARAALRLLALAACRPVHREVLLDALWSGSDPEAGLRNLQVAVSSIRQVLGGEAGRLLVREGDAYRLVVDEQSSDLIAFHAAVRAVRAAQADSRPDDLAAAATRALTLYRGELLAEDGPAEWVVGEREACRLDAAAVASALAECEMAAGRPGSAARACERGLRLDRYNDALWRLLMDACDAAGDRAAAARARHGYDDVMRELGVAR